MGGVPVAKDVANSVIDESLGSAVDEIGKKCAEEGMNHTVKIIIIPIIRKRMRR